jgi:hypothetical protein
MRKILYIIVSVILLSARSAWAQTPVVNPRFLDFDCPTPNGLTDPESYLVDFFAIGATAAIQPATPVALNQVTVINTTTPATCRITLAQVPYPAGIQVTAKGRAVNSGVSSDPSNATVPFGQKGKPGTLANFRATQ